MPAEPHASPGGLKKALAELVLNAEMDNHHLVDSAHAEASDGECSDSQRNLVPADSGCSINSELPSLSITRSSLQRTVPTAGSSPSGVG